jgi:hypothetical protein
MGLYLLSIDLTDLGRVQFWQKVAIETNPKYGRFEPLPGYREPADSPFVVVPQTNTVLEMYVNDRIFNPDPANQFLKEATFPYLARAKQGLELVSAICSGSDSIKWTDVAQSSVVDPADSESLEAVGYMIVIFVHMPELPSKILPKGFSRRGNLRPPQTKKELSSRLDELRVTVHRICQGKSATSIPLEGMNPALMRTLAFFRTGSWLPFKFPDDIREDVQREHAQFSKLIEDLDVNL